MACFGSCLAYFLSFPSQLRGGSVVPFFHPLVVHLKKEALFRSSVLGVSLVGVPGLIWPMVAGDFRGITPKVPPPQIEVEVYLSCTSPTYHHLSSVERESCGPTKTDKSLACTRSKARCATATYEVLMLTSSAPTIGLMGGNTTRTYAGGNLEKKVIKGTFVVRCGKPAGSSIYLLSYLRYHYCQIY